MRRVRLPLRHQTPNLYSSHHIKPNCLNGSLHSMPYIAHQINLFLSGYFFIGPVVLSSCSLLNCSHLLHVETRLHIASKGNKKYQHPYMTIRSFSCGYLIIILIMLYLLIICAASPAALPLRNDECFVNERYFAPLFSPNDIFTFHGFTITPTVP